MQHKKISFLFFVAVITSHYPVAAADVISCLRQLCCKRKNNPARESARSAAAAPSSLTSLHESSGNEPQVIDVAYLKTLLKADLDAKLLSAAEFGDLDKLKKCLEAGASMESRDAHGNTSLILAAGGRTFNDHAAVVRHLLATKADPKAVSNPGNTALHRAAYSSHGDAVSMAKMLLDAKADPYAQTQFDFDCFHAAQYSPTRNPAMVALLEKHAEKKKSS